MTDYQTSFFFCIKDDPLKNTAVSILRGLLTQILRENLDMLPFCYEKMRASGESTLNSFAIAKSLFETFTKRIDKQFIVIDGLDECTPEEIKSFLAYMIKLVQDHEEQNPGSLRLLILSQQVNDIQKRLPSTKGVAKWIMPIIPSDTAQDIHCYVAAKMEKTKEKYELDNEYTASIIEKTCLRADGKCNDCDEET
jgi:hypothetical protein